ncbi:hypothetical protein BZA05DRAFT_436888, partial [Tricharina praecox]|uniref:uncharacterized protein n=1 Tax=Tricharina praecox TaxID=43433 RepID=UPI0022205AB7
MKNDFTTIPRGSLFFYPIFCLVALSSLHRRVRCRIFAVAGEGIAYLLSPTAGICTFAQIIFAPDSDHLSPPVAACRRHNR